MGGELYYYYKMERLGLVLSLYTDGFLKDDTEGRAHYIKEFNEVKKCLM